MMSNVALILGDLNMSANALVQYQGIVMTYAEYLALRESEH